MLHSAWDDCTYQTNEMTNVSRALVFAALLSVALLLGGCASGSPSIVAPMAAETPAALVPEAAAAAPPVAAVPEPTTPAIAPRPAANAEAPWTAAVAEAADRADSATMGAETAAFAQEVPEIVEVASEAGADPAAAAPEEAAAPPAQTTRPLPPPDPGTGLSTLVEGGSNGRLEIALTFDAGADTGYGAEILDLLRDEGIPATFGMSGLWAQANPDLVQRMVSEGHQLINHTWDHPSLTGANTGMPPQTPEQVAQQLADTEAVVRDLTGYEMRPYFRPPYGDYDETSLRYLYDNGYYLSIMWTCDSHGWAGWSGQEIIDYCTTNIRPHEIVLMHFGSDAAGDYEALPGLIRFFRDNGYAFVTAEQMLQP